MEVSLEEAMEKGLAHHRAGRLSEAEDVYRQVLAIDPNYPDALHLLGMLAHQVNRDDVAEPLIRRAIAGAPLVADYQNSLAQVLQASGRIDEAIERYVGAISLQPDHGDAYGNLGIARRLKGEYAEAASALQQAAQLQPRNAQIFMQLGLVFLAMKQLDRAEEAFTAAARLEPHNPDAHTNLALTFQQQGRLEAAAAAARQAVDLRPDQPQLLANLGLILQQQQRHEFATAAFLSALRTRPNDPDTLAKLAFSLQALGRNDEALKALEHAVAQQPNFPQAWVNLGVALQAAERTDDAKEALMQAIALNPKFAEAYNNLGYCMMTKWELEDAISTLRRAIELDPNCAQAYGNLGMTLRRQGNYTDAITAYRKALALRPQMPRAHANILLSMNYDPMLDARTVFEEHVAWAAAHTSDVAVLGPSADHNRDPNRKLRIGYLSPDLRHHAVAYFIEPLLAGHDRDQFEAVCYADVSKPDHVTKRLQGLASHWRETSKLSATELAELVREDRIDVLIDLAGHNADRMTVFAMKPAPVQVAYLGYPNTTGLRAIDYRLTDPWADPPGQTEELHTEKLWRLPRCAWCYTAEQVAPVVSPLPVDEVGRITFGSFNRFPKLSQPLLETWLKLLHELPDARLLIKSVMLRDPSARARLEDRLQALGFPPDRTEVAPAVEQSQHLGTYRYVDIALDSYPYHGTTTTCEALYMGVPVITLAGDRHLSRVGVSLLHAVGMDDCIATDWDDYIAKAVQLARDRDRLRELRSTLRPRMEQSPLMDGPGLTREIESAFRQMWKTWCAT